MKEYTIINYPRTGNYVVRENGQFLKVDEITGNVTKCDTLKHATLFKSELECHDAVNKFYLGDRKIETTHKYFESYAINNKGKILYITDLPEKAEIGDCYVTLDGSATIIYTPVKDTTDNSGEWLRFDTDKAPKVLYEGGAPGNFSFGIKV